MYRQPVKWNWNLFKHGVGKLVPKLEPFEASQIASLRSIYASLIFFLSLSTNKRAELVYFALEIVLEVNKLSWHKNRSTANPTK